MTNSILFALGSIPAILYNNASLRRLYNSYVRLGMTFQELTQVLHIQPLLANTSETENEGVVEVFEYENNEPEKYTMVFINGKLDKWYTELKKSLS